MKQPFANVFGRLRLWQKFAILSAIATLLVALPFYLFFVGQQERIDVIRREQAGLQPAGRLLELLQALQKHRDLSSNVLGSQAVAEGFGRKKQKAGVDDALAALEAATEHLDYPGLAESRNRIREDWAALARGVDARQLSVAQSFEQHTGLIDRTLAALRAVLVGSGLDRDPDPATHYLIQAILFNAPLLTERMGQARAYGTDILAKVEMLRGLAEQRPGTDGRPGPAHRAESVVTQQDRVQMYSLTDRAQERLDETNDQFGWFELAGTGLKERLDESIQSANASIRDAIRLARAEIVDAGNVSFPMNEFRTQYTQAIDAVFGLLGAGAAALDEQFDRELGRARTTQITLTVIVLGVFALGILVAAFISNSITRPIGHLVGVVNRLAAGDSTVRAGIRSSDEIGILGRQFDIMVDQREAASEKIRRENEQLNNSVIDLLQAVAKLARRDLTTRVPVAEDITGPVADALNLLSVETAGVLNRVVEIAGNVARVSRQVKSRSDTVIHVAAEEKREVEQAAAELSQASEAMQDIARLALSCNEAAEKAIRNTHQAQETVLGTIQGITTIRDTIRETEKRIKRLGERSQEIGGVVNLINSIAERTHILALNASMHAASAGEAGRGFAVVANEVQKLAENAREATSKISGLVNSIQAETSDTVTTMNEAIGQVVRGTALAQQAGDEMRETRDTTAHLVELVQRIASSSEAQAQTTQRLRERAIQIQKSTEETYEQLQDQGLQTERLVDFSGGLVESVGVFILPRTEGATA